MRYALRQSWNRSGPADLVLIDGHYLEHVGRDAA